MRAADEKTRKAGGPLADALARTWKNPTGKAGFLIIGLLALTAFFAPLLAGDIPLFVSHEGRWLFPLLADYEEHRTTDWKAFAATNPQATVVMPLLSQSPVKVNMGKILEGPQAAHPCGTDTLGTDILARIIHGTRIALAVGLVAMGIAALIGILLGSLAGYFGGRVDMLVSRFIEIVICFPTFFLILTVLAFLPPSIYNIMIVIGLTGWTGIARLVRAECLRVRESDYVTAARALGYPIRRILVRHVLPNAIGPVLVSVSFGIAGAILTETALSFLGFGVQPPTPSWGQILSLAREHPQQAYLAIFPGLAVFIAVTGYNLLGEALRDAMDPKLRHK